MYTQTIPLTVLYKSPSKKNADNYSVGITPEEYIAITKTVHNYGMVKIKILDQTGLTSDEFVFRAIDVCNAILNSHWYANDSEYYVLRCTEVPQIF